MDFKGGIFVVYGDWLLEVVFCHLLQFAKVSVVEYCSDFISFSNWTLIMSFLISLMRFLTTAALEYFERFSSLSSGLS